MVIITRKEKKIYVTNIFEEAKTDLKIKDQIRYPTKTFGIIESNNKG